MVLAAKKARLSFFPAVMLSWHRTLAQPNPVRQVHHHSSICWSQLHISSIWQGGKGGGQKKGPGSLMDIKKEHPYEQTDVIMQNLLMLESFYRKVGRSARQSPLFRRL